MLHCPTKSSNKNNFSLLLSTSVEVGDNDREPLPWAKVSSAGLKFTGVFPVRTGLINNDDTLGVTD